MSVWVRDRWQPANFPLFSIYTGIYSIYTALLWPCTSLSNKQYQLRNKKPQVLMSTNLKITQSSKIQSYIFLSVYLNICLHFSSSSEHTCGQIWQQGQLTDTLATYLNTKSYLSPFLLWHSYSYFLQINLNRFIFCPTRSNWIKEGYF